MLCRSAVFRDARRFFTVTATLALLSFSTLADENDLNSQQLRRGAYLLRAAGCVACHTNSEHNGIFLAGGRALKTPFGTFYTPNITADPTHGIGNWTESDFVTAMTQGVAPNGTHYYPVFPYTAYSGITPMDLTDIWAYLQALPSSFTSNRKHDIKFPFSIRLTNWAWKLMFFRPTTYRADHTRSPEWNRGSYLVGSLGHCGECHTPRNIFGAIKSHYAYAGTKHGPGGEKIPNITPDQETGIGDWSQSDITWLLQTGFLPDGDVVGSSMADVVEHSTSHLTTEDQSAIAIYLKSLTPIYNQMPTNKGPAEDNINNW